VIPRLTYYNILKIIAKISSSLLFDVDLCDVSTSKPPAVYICKYL
jgi:hypothetical protein